MFLHGFRIPAFSRTLRKSFDNLPQRAFRTSRATERFRKMASSSFQASKASPGGLQAAFGGVLGRSWSILGALGRLLGALGRLLDRLAHVLERFWWHPRPSYVEIAREPLLLKNQWFCNDFKSWRSRFWRLRWTKNRSWSVLEATWSVWEASWAVLEGSWAVLEASWAILEASLAILKASWAVLAASWRHLGSQDRP